MKISHNIKNNIKEKILEIMYLENRPLSIRETTNILKKYKMSKSEPTIKKYLDELVQNKKLFLEMNQNDKN